MNNKSFVAFAELFTFIKKKNDEENLQRRLTGTLEQVKHLLSVNKNIDFHQNYNTYFLYVCGHGNVDVVKYLIDISEEYSGKKINIHMVKYYDNCFSVACCNNKLAIAKYLIDISEKYSNKKIYINDTIMINACSAGYIDIVKYLIKLSINSSYKNILNNKYRNQCFSHSCASNRTKVKKYLMSIGTYNNDEIVIDKMDIYKYNNEIVIYKIIL